MTRSEQVGHEAKRTVAEARACSDRLFQLIPRAGWYERPVPERHRLIFYLGHVEAFDWNLIGRRELALPSVHPELDQLFAFGIDPQAGQAPLDRPTDWPTVEEVRLYVREVRHRLDQLLAEVPPPWLDVIIEHRLMHAETFTYLLHNLPTPIRLPRQPLYAVPPSSAVHEEMIDIPGGTARLGLRGNGAHGAEPFGWDNEFDEHVVPVPGFSISRYKTTNRQYLRFVEAGASPPHFWRRHGDRWFWRTIGGEVPLPMDWPVSVTYHEARAYAQWIGKSLPTEAQFHRAAYGTPTGEERRYPWGDDSPTPRHGNFDGRRWNFVSVTATPEGDSAFGVAQLVGNGWEWTGTLFAPFPGFQAFPFYSGYSAPFFDGEHYVLKGGAARTAARLLRRSFRNWFRPNYPYGDATFRCVEQ